MRKIILTTITLLSSSIGWWIGSKIGLMTAFIFSMIFLGLGMYLGNRFTQF